MKPSPNFDLVAVATCPPIVTQGYLRLVIVEVVSANASNGLHIGAVSLQNLSVAGDGCFCII